MNKPEILKKRRDANPKSKDPTYVHKGMYKDEFKNESNEQFCLPGEEVKSKGKQDCTLEKKDNLKK